MSDYVIEVNDANFESEVLESSQPVLVDFWAEWCQPCNVLAPTVESLALKYEDKLKVVKLNVDEGVDSSSLYGIKAIPTLILFRHGKEAERVVGVPTNAKEFISQMLDKRYRKTLMPLHEQRRELRERQRHVFPWRQWRQFGARNGRVEKMLTMIEGN